MSALAFWKAVVQDESNFLERVTSLLRDGGFRYCVIGGVGVMNIDNGFGAAHLANRMNRL